MAGASLPNKMAGASIPRESIAQPGIFSETAERSPNFPFGWRSRDEEPLLGNPPKPAELDFLNSEPDPDLQLTPLKQNYQLKSLLRPHGGNSKVRHRVRFQESGDFLSESEQYIANRISEVTITEDFSDCEIVRDNENNNSSNVDHNLFPDVSYLNASDCMFYDDSSGLESPQHLSVEVVRELNPNKIPSPPTLIKDFPTETNSQTERNSSTNSKKHCQNSKNVITSSGIPTKVATNTTSDVDAESLPKGSNGIGVVQKRKMPKSVVNKANPSPVGAIPASAGVCPGISRTSALPVDSSSADPEVSIFSEPKLNSTLQIAQKIRSLQKKRPDLTAELKKNLEKEEQRVKINRKAASKVDIHCNQDLYRGLISVDVSEFEFEEAASVQKPVKVKHTKKKMISGLEPDLLEFFTEDMQKETADFSLPGIRNPTVETCLAPSLIAFDLYRHNRMWEGLPGTV